MLDPNRPQSLDALTGSLARALAGVRGSQVSVARRAARNASARATTDNPITGYRNVISSGTHLADRHRTYLLLGTLGELRRGTSRWPSSRDRRIGGAPA
jgi:hypothetical protein